MAEDQRGSTQDLHLAPRGRASNYTPQGEKLLDFKNSFYHLSEKVIIRRQSFLITVLPLWANSSKLFTFFVKISLGDLERFGANLEPTFCFDILI